MVLSLPTRNGNFILFHPDPHPGRVLSLPTRNGNIGRKATGSLLPLRFKPTYKEWKPSSTVSGAVSEMKF